MRSFAQPTRQERTCGLHCQHGPARVSGLTLDHPLNPRRRVRGHGQLRPTPGQFPDHDAFAGVVGQALEIRDAQRAESPIVVQSELRRLRIVLVFFFLIVRSRDRSMTTVLNRFQKHDYVLNDHLVRQMLKRLIEKEARWGEVCKCEYEPDTSASRCGVRLLL